MNNTEFSNEFDVLYNSITSNQAPGLDEYEKSVFLTKAQDEIVKAYFNPRANKTMEGFDASERRQIDFSMIMRSKVYETIKVLVDPDILGGNSSSNNKDSSNIYNAQVSIIFKPGATIDYVLSYNNRINITDKNLSYQVVVNDKDKFIASVDRNYYDIIISEETLGEKKVTMITLNPFVDSFFDLRDNTKAIALDSNILMFINEWVEVLRDEITTRLMVMPIHYTEYTRLMSKPYKRPVKNQAWRLIDNSSGEKRVEIIVGPNDTIQKYVTRYIKRPRPIILEPLSEGTSLEGYVGTDDNGNLVSNPNEATKGIECELDPILHEEILQRAVELAKAAYSGDANSYITLGQSSQTDIGVVPQQQSR